MAMPTAAQQISFERCYGVAKNGLADGVSPPSSFTLNAERYTYADGDGYAYVWLPFGLCRRLTEGDLEPFDHIARREPSEGGQNQVGDTLGRDAEEERLLDPINDRIRNFLYR